MKIPALAEKLGLTTLVKLLGDADLVDALNGDGEPIYIFCFAGIPCSVMLSGKDTFYAV